MIAELFYPKELKNIIADLRDNDDLNDAALFRLNQYIKKQVFFTFALFFSLICFLQFLSNSTLSIILIFAICALISLNSVFKIRNFIKEHAALYVYGCITTGVIESCHSKISGRSLARLGKVLQYNYAVNGKNYKSPLISVNAAFHCPQYENGQDIKAIYLPGDVAKTAPYLPSYKSLFHLRKDS